MPRKIPIGTLANYGYEGTVLLPVPLTITPDFKPSLLGSELEVKLKAPWLVCRKECIPGRRRVRADGAGAQHRRRSTPAPFEAALRGAAQPALGRARAEGRASTATRSQVSVPGLPAALRGKTLEFFPETAEVIETAAKWTQAWDGDVWTARVPLSPQRSAQPGR